MTHQSNSRREFLTIATAAASTLAMPLSAHAAPNVTGQADMTKDVQSKFSSQSSSSDWAVFPSATSLRSSPTKTQ
jgi:hypothetical protein